MSVIIKGVEQDSLNECGYYAVYSQAYEYKKNLIKDLYPKYISEIYRAQKEIQKVIEEVDKVLVASYENKSRSESENGIRNVLATQAGRHLTGQFKSAREYLAKMFQRVIVDYFIDHLDLKYGEEINLHVDIGVADMTIHRFEVEDYISDSQDVITIDIKRILGMGSVEKFTDPEAFCRALMFCMEMMIDVVTHAVVMQSNKDPEPTEGYDARPNTKYSQWVEINEGTTDVDIRNDDFWFDDRRCEIIGLNSNLVGLRPNIYICFADELKGECYVLDIEL